MWHVSGIEGDVHGQGAPKRGHPLTRIIRARVQTHLLAFLGNKEGKRKMWEGEGEKR